jgi:hypothetical protein
VEHGYERLQRMLPYAQRHDITPLQLACCFDLAYDPVCCVAPTLIQEPQTDPAHPARTIEDKRADLAGVPAISPLSEAEVQEIATIGDNFGSMVLKGARADYEGQAAADAWPLTERLRELAQRWQIEPERDLAYAG